METAAKERIDELVKGLSIDATDMLNELSKQSKNAAEVGKMAAEMRHEASKAKLAAKLIRAQVSRDVRSNPESYGIDIVMDSRGNPKKPTLDEYNTAIELDSRVTEAEAELAEAELIADIYRAIAQQYSARAHDLSSIIDILEMHTYGGGVPRDIDVKEWNKERIKLANAELEEDTTEEN